MANTYNDYTGDGSNRYFNLNFEYLRDDHVKVKVDGSEVGFVINTDLPTKRVYLNTAPANGAEVKVYRDSRGNFEAIADFVDGSVLTGDDLDEAYLHNLYVAQETSQGVGGELLFKKGGANYDAEGNKIINLGTPADSTDAANKGYVDQTIDNSIALGGSPAIVSLGGYDVTSAVTGVTQSLANWTNTNALDVTATGSTTARSLGDRFGDVVNVKDYGAVGNGTIDDTDAFRNALEAAENKTLVIPKPSNYYRITDGLAVYKNTDIEGNGSKVIFEAEEDKNYITGFQMASNTSINNLEGHITTNGFNVGMVIEGEFEKLYGAFIDIGLFYGVNNSIRGDLYSSYVPDISAASSPVGEWDAPQNVTVTNITGDISALPTTNEYGNSFIRMVNFVKNIDIQNIHCVGFAQYVDKETSWDVTTGNSVLNNNNLHDVVRFEYGNQVTPNAHASGENIKVSNIYGKGLRVQDHSGVVSMGNAHSFTVSNVTGESTGQVFQCGSSGDSTNLDSSVLRTNATNRIAENLTGLDLYTWFAGAHYNAGVNITPSDYEGTSAISPINNVIVRNVNITGLLDSTQTTSYPQYGVLLGDDTWDGDARHVSLENVFVSKFNTGIHLENCNNVNVDRAICTHNNIRGLSVASASGYIANSIIIENSYFKGNNLSSATDYTTNSGVGVSVFRGDNIIFRDCIFGDKDTANGTETQLHAVFLRDGQVGFVKFDSCLFANYEDATNSFDIRTNAATIQPVVRDCRSALTSSFIPKVSNQFVGVDLKAVASVKFTAAPSTVTISQQTNIASANYVSAGRYTFSFDTAMPNSNYYVMLTGGGGTTPEFFPVNYTTGNTASQFEVYVKDAVGAQADNSDIITGIVFYVNTPTDLGHDIL